MKRNIILLLFCLMASASSIQAQNSVDIDGRLQPFLDDFFEQCKKYGIDYNTKLFQLKNIDIVDTLPIAEGATVLGKVERDETGDIVKISINWVATLDPEILKVVAFHEFAHHFLDYQHTCQDCNEIMAANNSSYFDIANDWDSQLRLLFITSPVYLAKETTAPIAATSFE